MLKGYKTYIIAAIMAGLVFAHTMSWIDDSLYQTILAFLGVGSVATMSAKVNRLSQDVNK